VACIWLDAMYWATECARNLADAGVHKQITNRLLEPFMHMTTLVTATEWQNFFTLRDHADAQPEIQILAKAMRKALDESSPTLRTWHMPFVHDTLHQPGNLLAGISAARCARVSYLNHDGTNPDIEKDLTLARRLAASGHWSPFEHVACANHLAERSSMEANFQGWKQLRHIMAAYPKWLDDVSIARLFESDIVPLSA
jgi:Thymidylate synthase complementing protein